MQLVFAASAKADLRNIALYIARDSRRRARSFSKELRAPCLTLADYPLRFPAFERSKSLRKCVHGNYLIFYRVLNGQVEIIHILHGGIDLDDVPGFAN